MRLGSKNGNWRGGISSIKTADDVLKYPNLKERISQRLLKSSVPDKKSGCWNWVGITFKSSGRPRITLGGGMLAYRVSWVVFKGSTRGLCVLHSCDNILCINPDHLWLGTNKENSENMVNKGRQATGDRNGSRLYPDRLVRGANHHNRKDPRRVQTENNGNALLTNLQVLEIRRLYRPYINNHNPSNQRELASRFNVGVWVIQAIVKRKSWRSI